MTYPRILLTSLTMLTCLAPVSLAAEASEAPRPNRPPTWWSVKPRGKRLPADIPTDEHRAWYDRVGAETPRDTWLGVRLSPVPAALAAHLQLDGGGVMIGNVFRDSPADDAGLERYDVIIEANGTPIEGKVEAFSKYVRDREPDETLKLTIYHEGRKANRTIELARRPADWHELELKYKDDPDVSLKRKFGLRGKILRPGPDGWELKDLGEIPELQDLYDHLVPHVESHASDAEIDELRQVDPKGRVLHVRRRQDGSIVVKRYQSRDGEDDAEVKTYDSMDELEKADPQAYELLQSARPELLLPDRYDSAARQYAEQLREQWRKYRDAARNYADAMRDYLEKHPWPGRDADEKWQEWRERFFQGPLEDLKEEPKRLYRFIEPKPEWFQPPPPAARFELGPDGEITVHLRNADAELSTTFESKEALKQKAPELYEKFKELQEQVR